MRDWQLETPVAFLIFNRPDTTERVFTEIARARPPKLLVIADGPRSDRPGEAELCAQTRRIIERVDWECEVLTDFSEQNLGCRARVSSGLSWVFEQVEEAIILEDDCLPHPSFFRYCEEMLARYRDDERIGQISGCNFQHHRQPSKYSYYYSIYNHIWGWASWRRAWQGYDLKMRDWPAMRDEEWLRHLLPSSRAVRLWEETFQNVYEGKVDTWDYQWTFSCWAQGRLTVLPTVNLISNIGFGEGATHTTQVSDLANMPTEEMTFPLHHPPFLLRDTDADLHTQTQVLDTSLYRRVRNRAKRLLQLR